MKKIYLPIIASIGLSLTLSAQEKSQQELRGDKDAFSYSYSKAINSYEHANTLSPEGKSNLATCYRKMGQNIEADSMYKTYINNTNVLPEEYYNYAQVLKVNGKNAESETWMNRFSIAKPNDLRVKDYQMHKGEFASLSSDQGKYTIEHAPMNTSAQDFGATYYKDKIVFASSRGGALFSKEDNWHSEPYLDLYVSELENGKLKTPVEFDEELNDKFHDGPASFSKNGNFMVLTKNAAKDKSKDRIVELQLFSSVYKDGKWQEPIAFALNNPAYSVGHPCLTADGMTLYFASNIPGGFGGSDIYKVICDYNGTWGTPVNLGDKVNTEGDEVFPFYEEVSMTLLYSSDGRYGLGGLDIFMCSLKDPNGIQSTNAGYPLNTKYDDFSAVVDNNLSKGYFSSDRLGGSGSDDIYSFDMLKKETAKKIQGITKETNGKIVPQSYVSLFDAKDSLLETRTTSADGFYSFIVMPNASYKLVGKKELYQEGQNSASTFSKDSIVKADITLSKKAAPQKEPKITVSIPPPEILNSIYFDLNKSNIRPDATTELDKIVKVMNDNPEMVLVLSSHTDCRATKAYNQRLSDRREKSSSDYIKKRITTPSRISGKGYGETESVNSCNCEGDVVSDCTEIEFQQDRKTDFIIVNKSLTVAK